MRIPLIPELLNIKILQIMDIMDTARLNIKRRREIRGLRQQDMADKLCMSLRSYQSLESGETKLDIERLEKIAGILETSMEELLRQEGNYFHQEFKEATGFGFGNENIFNNGGGKEIVDKLIAAKDEEISLLKEENQVFREDMKSLKEDNKYLRDKIDQLMEVIGKKG
jgi:transcriptional regulator with XRE-family HTH domain